MTQLQQHQVPDGMVANVPWGQPLDRWSDRMIERGIANVEDDQHFPRLHDSLLAEAASRGIEL